MPPRGKKRGQVQVVAQDLDTFTAQQEEKKQEKINKDKGIVPESSLPPGQLAYKKALDHCTDGELRHYYYLDNKMIEYYCLPAQGNQDLVFANNEELLENLEEEVLLFNMRQNIQELEFVYNLPFGKFWAQMTRNDKVATFLD